MRTASSSYKRAVVEYYRHTPDDTTADGDWFAALKLALVRRLCAADARVLSVGCGSGVFEDDLRQHVRAVHGCDLTLDALKRFRQRLGGSGRNVSTVDGDVSSLPYRSGSFDVVYSFSTLYYVAEIEAALGEIYRVLRPGGTALLEFGNLYSMNALHSSVRYGCPHFFLSLGRIRSLLNLHRWTSTETRYFFLFPSFALRGPLRALFSSRWRGRTVNEWVSSLPAVRHLSCKVITTSTKAPGCRS